MIFFSKQHFFSRSVYFILLCLVLFFVFNNSEKKTANSSEIYKRGVVEEISDLPLDFVLEPYDLEQEVKIRLKDSDQLVDATFTNRPQTNLDDLEKNDEVIVLKTNAFADKTRYIITDPYRLGSLKIIGLFFLVLIILIAGKKGISSLFGLLVSIGILVKFTVPFIMNGYSPFLIAGISVCFIAVFSILIGHGNTLCSRIALLSTLICVMFSLLLSKWFVVFSKLFGLGNEEAFYLQFSNVGSVDIRGLLLAGMVIGVLGVLDDVTTSQCAAVEEIHLTNPQLSFLELAKKGLRIGKEHIVSLVNTLALAYVGVSLPLVLLFSSSEVSLPWWVLLNSEMIAEELIRTLVGSVVLVLAVPVSAYLSAYVFTKKYGSSR